MNAKVSESAASSTLTGQEISKAREYLTLTRNTVIESVSNLSNSQWHFKPDAEAWSIAEILEHLAIVESGVHNRIHQMPDASLSEESRSNSQIEETIIRDVPRRTTKHKAPPPICPTGQWDPSETLAHFLERRNRTIDLLVEAPCLRGRVVAHPVAGNWDGYQWILAVGAHSARHIEQIGEVKASPAFPSA